MKIAIKFGDNDFYSTFTHVLKILSVAVQKVEYRRVLFTKDKAKICWIINQLSPICYVLFQNHWEYNGFEKIEGHNTSSSEYYQKMQKYLSITEDRILLDEEVEKYFAENDWDNSETFWMVVNDHTGEVFIDSH